MTTTNHAILHLFMIKPPFPKNPNISTRQNSIRVNAHNHRASRTTPPFFRPPQNGVSLHSRAAPGYPEHPLLTVCSSVCFSCSRS